MQNRGMQFIGDEMPAPVSTVVVEKAPAKAAAQPVRNGQVNTLAKKLLSKKAAQEQPKALDTPEEEEEDEEREEGEKEAEVEKPARKPKKTGRKPQQRLPRNKSLYRMRDLQASNKPILKNLTMHRIVKKYTREILQRSSVLYEKRAMQALMRIIEVMVCERLLLAQNICLQGGRKTLMLHHLESAEHLLSNPNLTQWTVQDFEAEEGRLEPSRFRNSRLGQQQQPQ